MKKREVKQNNQVIFRKSSRTPEGVWDKFAKVEQLTDDQQAKFKQYYDMLIAHNERYNLTAITELLAVTRHHFSDSIALRNHHDMATVKGLVDIGTGAGFPSIPLKIMFPDLPIVLIEPSKKRQGFLKEVISSLGLANIEIFDNDWRTFIRTTHGDLNLFVTRATLPMKELVRVFKPSSAYNTGTLVYWASEQWEPEIEIAPLIDKDAAYKVGTRKRRLIFLKKSAK